ncbi:hypothetical protein JXL21_10715 [Candidatus Bathyarchaeota archaeon]|nr:hypothetical protein [Candidatus Bathyarchaeota archaeon]
MKYIVEVLDRYPDVNIGVLVAEGLTIKRSDPALEPVKRVALSVAGRRLGDTPTRHPFIASWRDMYRSFGTKPGDYRPSAEALVRRSLKNGVLPAINTAVDAYNAVSVRHLIPMGGFDLDYIEGDIRLRISPGGEAFTPLRSEKAETTYEGEAVYADDARILTRRWNYRDCDETRITEETHGAALFIDGSESIPRAAVEAALKDLETLLRVHCGGEYKSAVASTEDREIRLR